MVKKLVFSGFICLFIVINMAGCVDVGDIVQFSITSFEVKPAIITEGQTANLSWVVMSAQSVSIDHGIGNVANMGSRIIQPIETTTYTLTAVNGSQTRTATTQVIVNPKDGDSSQETPSIQFVKDNLADKLTIASAQPSDLLWSDFVISGTCDSSGLGTYVVAGDVISDCYGIISIRYIPTNTLLGSWEFDSSTPSIQFIKNDVDDVLTVASADPSDILWSDIDVIGTCDTSGLGTYVIAGDQITGCSGTISIRYIPTNTLLGTWDFAD